MSPTRANAGLYNAIKFAKKRKGDQVRRKRSAMIRQGRRMERQSDTISLAVFHRTDRSALFANVRHTVGNLAGQLNLNRSIPHPWTSLVLSSLPIHAGVVTSATVAREFCEHRSLELVCWLWESATSSPHASVAAAAAAAAASYVTRRVLFTRRHGACPYNACKRVLSPGSPRKFD